MPHRPGLCFWKIHALMFRTAETPRNKALLAFRAGPRAGQNTVASPSAWVRTEKEVCAQICPPKRHQTLCRYFAAEVPLLGCATPPPAPAERNAPSTIVIAVAFGMIESSQTSATDSSLLLESVYISPECMKHWRCAERPRLCFAWDKGRPPSQS